jgi:hypothetical protein
MIRVILPQHLRTLAHTGPEITLEVGPPVTQRSVLDALEARYPIGLSPTGADAPASKHFACANSALAALKCGALS